jgi:mannan endo-1,4-beta-mannosidase
VDAPNWGQDWQFFMRNNAASVFASDALRNTMFSIHMYGVFDTPEGIEDYILHFVRAKLPLVIGEFGHFHTDGDPDEDAILRLARKYGIGYLGWAWSGNCCNGEYLDMVTNFDPTLMTWWGKRIINGQNGIRLTSVEASIYSGERNPRVMSVTRADPNPTSLGSVHFTLTFSEPVTGVDTIAPFKDFRLTTTGVTGAAITSVSGSGKTYTVTVNTGTGSGTIRLDVLDNDTIIDGKRNTLGGPGPGYGNYKAGETYTVTKPANASVP